MTQKQIMKRSIQSIKSCYPSRIPFSFYNSLSKTSNNLSNLNTVSSRFIYTQKDYFGAFQPHLEDSMFRHTSTAKSLVIKRNEALMKTNTPIGMQLLNFPFNYKFIRSEPVRTFIPPLDYMLYKFAFDRSFSLEEFCDGVKTAYEALRPVLIKRGEREILQQIDSDIPPVSTESMDTPQEMDFFIRSVTTDELYTAIQDYYRELIKDGQHLCGEFNRVSNVRIQAILTRTNPSTNGVDTTIVAYIKSEESIHLRNDKNDIVFGDSEPYEKISSWYFEKVDGENEWKLSYMEI